MCNRRSKRRALRLTAFRRPSRRSIIIPGGSPSKAAFRSRSLPNWRSAGMKSNDGRTGSGPPARSARSSPTVAAVSSKRAPIRGAPRMPWVGEAAPSNSVLSPRTGRGDPKLALHCRHAGGTAPGERRSGLGCRCRRIEALGRARQRPIPLVRPHLIVAIVLRRVAVHHVAVIERVGAAAYLVLDREQVLAGVEAHDVLPTILVLIAFFGDQPPLFELVVRARELLGVDLQVMPVEFRYFPVGLAEDQLLLVPGADMGGAALAVLLDASRGVKDLAVEARDAVGGPFRHGELD